MKRKLIKISLFLSAFTPLYFLVIVRYVVDIINKNLSLNALNSLNLILSSLCIIMGFFGIAFCFNSPKQEKQIVIKSRKNITDQYFLGYFSIFVLFAFSFQLELISMFCVYFLIILLIGIVYVNNDLFYINPLLNLLGYSLFEVTYEINGKTITSKVFYKGDLEVNESHEICSSTTHFFLIKK